MLLFVVVAVSVVLGSAAAVATLPALPVLSDGDAAVEGSGEQGEPETFDPLDYDFDAHTGPRTETFDELEGDDTDWYRLEGDGTVLEGVATSPDVGVLVDDAVDPVVRDCRLRGGVRVYDHGERRGRVVVEHCDVGAPGNGVSGLAMVVRHSRVSTGNDGLTPTGGAKGVETVIEYNKIERDGTRDGDRHHDGVQLWQGGNATIRRNWISGWDTSAVMVKSDKELEPGDGPVADVLVEENYLHNPSGHYAVQVRDGGQGRPRFVTIRDNAFGPLEGEAVSTGPSPSEQAVFVRTEQQRDRAVAAQEADPGVLDRRVSEHGMTEDQADARTWIVWDGNVWAETGEEVTPPGGWHTPSVEAADGR